MIMKQKTQIQANISNETSLVQQEILSYSDKELDNNIRKIKNREWSLIINYSIFSDYNENI